MTQKALAIIPARFQSSRFPGKPLAMLAAKPMLWHVYHNVTESALFSKTVIATDDESIKDAAEQWGAEVIMTSDKHPSGTDRCAEAAIKAGGGYDVVVNIQGDEPFIKKAPLATILQLFEKEEVNIATLVQRITQQGDLLNQNNVRVVINKFGEALYFSRSVIPYARGVDIAGWLEHFSYLKHIGIYAFRPKTLQEIVLLEPSSLENTEMLEQLRWLENGYKVHTAETDYKMLSVDTPQDLEAAELYYKKIHQSV